MQNQTISVCELVSARYLTLTERKYSGMSYENINRKLSETTNIQTNQSITPEDAKALAANASPILLLKAVSVCQTVSSDEISKTILNEVGQSALETILSTGESVTNYTADKDQIENSKLGSDVKTCLHLVDKGMSKEKLKEYLPSIKKADKAVVESVLRCNGRNIGLVIPNLSLSPIFKTLRGLRLAKKVKKEKRTESIHEIARRMAIDHLLTRASILNHSVSQIDIEKEITASQIQSLNNMLVLMFNERINHESNIEKHNVAIEQGNMR